MSDRRSALVIGGGIAGLQASIDLARAGLGVFLIERKPRLGGHTSLLCKIFPTLETAEELVKPVFQSVTEHPNIKIFSYSEIDYEVGLITRKAIYLPSPYPVPPKYLIDRENCLYFKDRSCHACRDACPENAIVYEQKAVEEKLKADVIIVATGFRPYDARKAGQYKYGIYRNVIAGMEYERLCNPNGPTGGKIVRVSDGAKPKGVTFILCVGSREEENHGYCCRVGCSNALKHAYLLRGQYGDEIDIYICYTDMRAVGRRAEEFYRKTRESQVNFIHGEPSEVRELTDQSLTLDVYDQSTSKLLSITADLVVLETGLEPEIGLQEKLRLPLDVNGFFKEAHPKLATTETPVKGIFLAGTVEAPMDIGETVAHASAAAMKAFILAYQKP